MPTADQVVIDPNTATVGFAFQDTTFASDTSAHKPAPVKLVTIVGIPLNDAGWRTNRQHLRTWQFLSI